MTQGPVLREKKRYESKNNGLVPPMHFTVVADGGGAGVLTPCKKGKGCFPFPL